MSKKTQAEIDRDIIEGATTFALTEPLLEKFLQFLGLTVAILGILKLTGNGQLFLVQDTLFYSLIMITVAVFYVHYKYNIIELQKKTTYAKRAAERVEGTVEDLRWFRL